MRESSTPTLDEFDPTIIYTQWLVIQDIRKKFDYEMGTLQVLLSGAVGSAKSILMAHLIVTHCLLFENANVGIGRKTKAALKNTLIDKILQHLRSFPEIYTYNRSTGNFRFSNGSKITAYSWGDADIYKVRSEEFSAFAIEELVENETKEFYFEILMRIGRLTHVKEKWLISATNPDEPDHWVYKELIEKRLQNVHVYYSKTADNPFLPQSYISMLEENLDKKLAERMLLGKWISIASDKIYYNYEPEKNYIEDKPFLENLPIRITFDFNIGHGKPMSACAFQYVDDAFFIIEEFVIEKADTWELLSEIAHRKILDYKTTYIIYGDATGKARNTASKKSDYDIINNFLQNYGCKYTLNVPLSNPPIRTRHNIINSLCENMHGKIRLYVTKKCITVNEGLRLCKLLKGSKYIEDDSKHYQHVVAALGYGLIRALSEIETKPSRTIQL